MFFTPDNDRSGSAGSGGGSRAKTESTDEEQEMADFLSSLDELTTSSNTNTSSSSANGAAGGFRGSGGGGGGSGSNNSPGFGADLFFGSSTRGTRADDGFGAGSIGGTDSKVNTGRVAQEPPEWMKGFQALEIPGEDERKRAGPARQDYDDSNDGPAPYALAEQHEVLGVEPEILDGEDYHTEVGNVMPTPDATAVLSRKSGTDDQNPSSRREVRHSHVGDPTADSSRPTASADRTDYWPPRDSNTTPHPRYPIGLNNAQQRRPQPAVGAAGEATEERLDWPGTLDILGLAESDGQPQQRQQQRDKSESSDVAAELRVSEGLPAMPPPPPRPETFPDFVEVRDPRLVAQWPKPSASGVSKTPGGGRAGGGWPTDGGAGDKQQQAWPAPLRTVEMYLRPDVTWESVSNVYMAVMLSRGLVVREQTENLVTAEKAADSSGDWATVTLQIGVTRHKLRTLVMQFYADTRAPIRSLSGTLARFSGRAGNDLYSAIRDALVERRMPLSFLAMEAREISLDPHYVRDLVGMYAHENLVNLTRYALPLEEFVRDEEERSARLEATLLPKYNAHGLVPPRPTRSKQLSAYPLTTRRPPVSSCGVDEARAVVERAREHARSFDDVGKSKGEGPGVGDGTAEKEGEERGRGKEEGLVSGTAEGIRSLLRATWEVVKEWCDEEAEARVKRKDSQVRDRLLAVERHREALIAALRDGAGGAAALTTPSGREFAARFRPMAEEAVLAECKAVHGKRVGQLYLTFNHLCFYSSVLGFTSQKVLPLLTVASVSHASSSLGVDTLTVVDRGGESHSFAVTAVEPGFPERFHDLFQQVLVMCKADASRRAAKEAAAGGGLTGDPASLYVEPDEVQILARVQRLAKVRQLRQAREQQQRKAVGNTTAPVTLSPHPPPVAAFDTPVAITKAFDPSDRPPPPPYTRTEGGEAADSGVGTPGQGGERNVGVGEALGMGMEGGADTGVRVNVLGGGEGEGSGRPASMMAMGIQAFLEESQRRSA